MNLDAIKQIIKLAKDEGLAELKVDTKDIKVEVKFSTGAPVPVHYAQPQTMNTQAAVSHAKAPTELNVHMITSPFVGTFYTSPSPGKPIYVKVGDRVKVGQPLCVLEAMKIMNEIDADVNGEIIEILVENESLVEFAQPLFKIKLQ